MNVRHRFAAAAAVAAGALGLSGLAASPASATIYSGCVWNAACNYYSPSQAGSATSWDTAMSEYGSANFLSSGAGQGQDVKNNAASGWNTKADYYLRVYVSPGYGGYSQRMSPVYDSGDAISFNSSLRNKNDSHRWTIS